MTRMRRLLVATIVALIPLALIPIATAHTCQGSDCGPCVKGETHTHQDAHGQCTSGPGYFTDQGYGGQKASPAGGLLGTVLALGLVALLVGRRVA